MAIENLKENMETEKELVKEIFVFYSQLDNLERLYPYERRDREREILTKAINSCVGRLRIVNNSIPSLIEAISPFKSLGKEKEKVEGLVKISYVPEGKKGVSITIEEKDKEKFLQELSLSKETLRRLSKGKKEKKQVFLELRKASFYAKISNKIFLNTSNNFVNKGKFKKLNSNLRKANMPYLLTTYLSMAFFSSLMALIVSVIFFVVYLFFNSTIDVVLRNLLIVFVLPIVTFISFYFYPYAEARSIESKINQELPFVALHMSAVAGSGIEPSQIFKIVGLGREYPNTKKEIKKIINQVNVYGFDLITALKNTARETSSRKLSELFNGMATTISGGGSLTEFLDKRAETLLFDYKLEREKYTKSAETFMDIYISIVIAAPMIMTLLLVLMSVSSISVGLSSNALSLVIIAIISLINIIFLVYLHLSQPSY